MILDSKKPGVSLAKVIGIELIIIIIILFLTCSISSDNAEMKMNKIKKHVKEPIIYKSQKIRTVTAYNVGDVNQCSGDPCQSANGENICLAISLGYNRCAANFVPFGTVLNIESIGRCLVTDRMNSKYPNRVDIAFAYEDLRAKEFGIKSLNVKIYR